MPTVAPPAWDNVPAELADRQQWLLWKFEEPEKPGQKWRKVPYYVKGGRRTGDQGSDRDRARLAVLDVVRRAFERSPGAWHGVGIAFLDGDGLVGIDLDGAIDDSGEVLERHQAIVDSCPGTFVEISPSGRGFHIIGHGASKMARSNDIGVEVFAGSRQFMTITGRLWAGRDPVLAPLLPMVLDGLQAMIAKAKEDRHARKAAPAQPEASRPARPPTRGEESYEELQQRVESALQAISPDAEYEDWLAIGWALRDAFDESGFELWNSWSSRGGSYPGEGKLREKWRSFKTSGKQPGECVGVIFKRAAQAGWKQPRRAAGLHLVGAPAPAPRATSEAAAGSDSGGEPAGPPEDFAPPEDVPPAGEPELGDVLLRGAKGKPEDCRENVLYCLRHDPELQGLVALNLFTELQDKRRRPPWGGEPGQWDDEDDLMLGEYLARTHGLLIRGAGTIKAGVQMAARENKYHPILAGLKALEWDRTPRLEHWMVDCLGVTDRPYVRLVSRFFLLGMVARLLRPGCKFDYMLILQGDQGLGKSTAFRALADPYFMDTPFRIGDKDSYLSLQGVWLVEFSELEALSKSESTAIKAFVSSVEDRYRPPYGSRMVKAPRRSVLCGTTNADSFLKDATGERRFWPVHVTEVRADALKAIRDQLFAEAMYVLTQEKDADRRRYYPTREEERELFHPEVDRWRIVDVWTDILGDYIARDTNRPNDPVDEDPPARRGFFTAQELFRVLDIKAERMDNAKLMQGRISNAMRELGFKAERDPAGARKRGYLRPGWEFARGKCRPIPAPQAENEPGGADALPL